MKKLLMPLALCLPLLANAQVYRCGNEYRSTPCNNGQDKPLKLHMLQPATDNRTPLVPVYHCKSHQGAFFWSEAPCSKRRATLDRTVKVPADLDWDVKLNMARQIYSQQTSGNQKHRTASTHQPKQRANNCDRIKEALRNVDSRARAGGSAHYMESLNEERRRLLRQQAECR